MHDSGDTIVAVASGNANAGVAVIRVSGAKALDILYHMNAKAVTARMAEVRNLYDHQGFFLDKALILYFTTPKSFTGEDVVEIHPHGNRFLVEKIISTIIFFGARLARPGEFSERAFINGKIDLVQAEAIADLIAAQSAAAVCASQQSLSGLFSQDINSIANFITETRVYCETLIDFSDDIESDGSDNVNYYSLIENNLLTIINKLSFLLKQADQGLNISRIPSILLFGKPNVGKSSLMNIFARDDVAIVNESAGTTRDILKNTVNIGSMTFQLLDSAGLNCSRDPVEFEGIRRAKNSFSTVDLVLYVVDVNESIKHAVDFLVQNINIDNKSIFIVKNKADLLNNESIFFEIDSKFSFDSIKFFCYTSSITGFGIDSLKNAIVDFFEIRHFETPFSARQRHIDLIRKSLGMVSQARRSLVDFSFELMAEDLRSAAEYLFEITGKITTDEMLGKIFSTFCVGK